MIFNKELAELRAAQRADAQLFESQVRAALHAASPTRAVRKHPYAYMGAAALLGLLVAPTPGGKESNPSKKNDHRMTRWFGHLLKKIFPSVAGFIPDSSAPPTSPAAVETPQPKSPAMMDGILTIVQAAAAMYANRAGGGNVSPPHMQAGDAGSVETNAWNVNFHGGPSPDERSAHHAGEAA